MALNRESLQAIRTGEFRAQWPVLLAGFVLLFFVTGAPSYSLPFIFKEVARETGWTREQVTLLATMKFSFGALSAIFFGMLLDRVGDRRGILIAAVLNAAATGCMLFVTDLWNYYLVGAAMGLTGPGVQAGVKILLSREFTQHQGTAVGLGLTGSSLAGVLFPVIIVALLANFDWRTSLALITVGTWLIALPIFLWGTKNVKDERHEAPTASRGASEYTMWGMFRELAVTREFWCIGLSIFLIGLVDMGIAQHQVLFLENDRNIARGIVVAAASATAIIGFFSKIAFGAVYDKWSLKGVAFAYALLIIDPVLALLVIGPVTAFAFAMLRGTAHGALLVDVPVVAKHVYGKRNLGLIIGLFTSFLNLGFAAGPWVMGRIFTVFGDYHYGFILFSFLALIAVLMIRMVTPHAWLASKAAETPPMPAAPTASQPQ